MRLRVGTLERVAHGRAEDGAIGVRRGDVDQSIQIGRVQVRSRGIVHEDERVVVELRRQCVQCGEHRIRTFAAAGAVQ